MVSVLARGGDAGPPPVLVRTTRVDPAELDDEAGRLHRFADLVEGVRARLVTLGLGLAAAGHDETAALLDVAVGRLAQASSAAWRDRLALAQARDGYQQAEATSTASVAAAGAAGPSLTGVAVRGIREALDVLGLDGTERALAVSDGAVAVRQVGGWQQRAPSGTAGLAARVPETGPDRGQLRIEAYAQPDGTVRYLAYIGGTDTRGGPAEPWDLRADLAADPGFGVSAPERAALAALHEAGARPGDEVLLVGYSLGGMVADAIARRGGFRVPLLVTFGSPVAAKPAPGETLELAFEHADDPVPATEGAVLPRAADEPGRTVVRRSVFGGAPHAPVAPHALAEYRATASGADASGDAAVRAAASIVASFTGGGLAHVTTWRADRVPSPARSDSARSDSTRARPTPSPAPGPPPRPSVPQGPPPADGSGPDRVDRPR